MGLEPIGFARRNHDKLWIDPADCVDFLKEAVFFLVNRGITVSIYNFPLCVLSHELRPLAEKSISDWKNIYLPACDRCAAREHCCGFFRSVTNQWISRSFGPIKHVNLTSKQDMVEAMS